MKVVLAIILIFSAGHPLAAQNVRWETLTNKNEFSIAMPEGTRGVTDNSGYYLGRPPGNHISKRVIVSRQISGTVLIMEFYEGDIKDVRDELIKRITEHRSSPYVQATNGELGSIAVSKFQRKQDKLFSQQQFALFKKRLYVIQAHSRTENDPIAGYYFRSMSLLADGKTIRPNIVPGGSVETVLEPPNIAEETETDADDTPIAGKPDRDVIYLYKPRPRFTSVAGGSSGEINLNVLFSASGKIKKIDFESGQRVFFDSAIAAAKGILFVPAEKDGKLVSVWKKVFYSFSFD